MLVAPSAGVRCSARVQLLLHRSGYPDGIERRGPRTRPLRRGPSTVEDAPGGIQTKFGLNPLEFGE